MSLRQCLSHRCLFWKKVVGQDNRVVLEQGARLFGYVEMRGRNNRVILHDNAFVSGRIFIKGSNLTISVGTNTHMRNTYLLAQEGASITIGANGLFSREVEIRTSDAHSLFDLQSGRRINRAAAVVIGDNVWVGTRTIISKGSAIPSNCVVGAMSFVNKAFDVENALIAGVPARITRKNIAWHRERRSRLPKT